MKRTRFLWFGLLLYVFGCSVPKDDFEIIYSEIDKCLNSEDKQELLACDSFTCIQQHFKEGFGVKYENRLKGIFSNIPEKIQRQLDSLNIDHKYQDETLFYGFLKYKKGQTYNIIELNNEIKLYYSNERMLVKSYYQSIEDSIKRIADVNNKRVSEFDTIVLTFPVEKNLSGIPVIKYRNEVIGEKLIELSGVVSKKEIIENEFDPKGRYGFIIELQILNVSTSPLIFQNREIRIGDTFNLDLYYYNKVIEVL